MIIQFVLHFVMLLLLMDLNVGKGFIRLTVGVKYGRLRVEGKGRKYILWK